MFIKRHKVKLHDVLGELVSRAVLGMALLRSGDWAEVWITVRFNQGHVKLPAHIIQILVRVNIQDYSISMNFEFKTKQEQECP